MSSSNIELAVQSGKGESVAHRVGGRAGAPLHIKAQSGSNYLLKGEDGQAPENITLKRVGNNLEVTLEGDNQPGLIIENYFAQEPAPGLYGTDSSGQLHEFVRTDGEGGIFTLADGESEAAALGSAPAVIPEQEDGGMFVLFPLLAAASLAGLAAYAIGRDDDEPAPPPLGKTPDGVASANDDVGAITGPIARGGTTDDTMPEFRGRGTPGNTIKVYDHGQLIGQTTVDPGGNWVLTPDALADGTHSVTVTDTPTGGTESAPSAPFDFVSDTVAPAPSQNDQALDDHGDQQGPIAPGGITDDSTPTLSGDVEPGSQVVIEENGVPLGSATVDDNGHWEFTPDTPLADGAHELVPVVIDPAGNQTSGEPIAVTVDTLAPGVPTIGALTDNVGPIQGDLANGALTDDTTPTLSGTAEPGSTVTIKDNGRVLGSVSVDANGNWTYTPDALPDGKHSFTTVATDTAGNTSGESPAFEITTDGQPPDSGNLKITGVEDDQGMITGNVAPGGITDDMEPLIKGTGTAGDTIIVKVGERVLGTTAVGQDGTWSLQVLSANRLANGPNVIVAVERDPAGNETISEGYSFVVYGGNVPPAPSIVTVTDDVGVVHAMQKGEVTNDATPTIAGTSTAGTVVYIYDGDATGQALGSTTVNADGQWRFTSPALAEGEHNFVATAVDAVGQVSPATAGWAFSVDTTAPPASQNDQASDDQGDQQGPIAPGGITDDSTPTLSGDVEPGSQVVIEENGVPLGSATVDDNGHWEFTPDTPLADGAHELVPVVIDPAGNETSGAPIAVTVDTTNVPVSIGAVKDDTGSVTGNLSQGEVTDDTQPEFTGQAKPGSSITLMDGSTVLGTAQAGADGSWHITPDTPLAQGSHAVVAHAVDPAGNASQTSAFTFSVDTQAPATPTIGGAFDDVGTTTGPLASGAVTDDNAPTLNGTADAGSLVTIYDNDNPIGSVTAAADGTWQFTPTSELTEGVHAFTTTATDQAGNVSGASAPFDLTTDYTPPDASKLAITGVEDDQGVITGNVAPGSVTDDAAPLVSGTGTAGDTIIVKVGERVLGTTTVAQDGTWSVQVENSNALATGPNAIVAEERDPAGNAINSAPYTVNLAGGAPPAPSIVTVTDDVGVVHAMQKGEVTNDATPTIAGTSTAGTVVHIYDGDATGQALGSTTVNADGQWRFTSPALAEGEHNFVATAVDAVGQVSPATAGWAFSVDTTAPAPSQNDQASDDQGDQQGPIAPGGITDDSTPTLSGDVEPGSQVVIEENGVPLGSATVDDNGHWEFTPDTPLADGAHELVPVVIDPAGNETSGAPIAVTVDTTNVPVSIGAVKDDTGSVTGNLSQGEVTDDTQPEFTGQAKPGSSITLMDGSTVLGTAQAGADGSWHITPDTPLAQGSHAVVAHAVDPAGNASQTSAFTFSVDTQAPATPTIGGAFDDVGTTTGPLASGAVTDDNAPTLNGTADAGSLVTIYDNDNPIGSVTAAADGTWQFTPTSELTEGAHAFTTTATDQAGNVSGASTPFDLTTDYTPPDASKLAITGVEDDQGVITGNVAPGSVTDDAAPLVSGTGTAGDTIIVKVGERVLGTTTVAQDGTWSVQVENSNALATGPNAIVAEERDPAGNAINSAPYTVNLAGGAPPAPSIVTVTDDVGVVHAMQKGEVTNDATPTIAGTSTAGTVVYIYDGDATGQALGSTTVNADGQWRFTSPALAEGEHNFVATAVDAVGQVSPATAGWAFSVDTTAPAPSQNDQASDDQGDQQGPIAPGGITDDSTPTLSGDVEPGSQVVIEENGVPLGSATVDDNGHWEFTPDTPLADGAHELVPVVIDPAGNETSGAPIAVTVDTTNVPVSIGAVKDDTGSVTGNLSQGEVTDDTQPEFTGQAKPGSSITLMDGSTVLGTAQAGADGSWHITPDTPLAQGSHAVVAHAVDPAGNASQTSAFTFSVDTQAPATPTIGGAFDDVGTTTGPLASGAVTDDNAPTLNGTADAGSLVTIYDNDNPIGSVTAAADGTWQFTPTSELTEGAHAFTTTATDQAGNVSGASAPFDLTTDYTPPDASKLAITGVEDDQGVITGNVAPGTVTDDAAPLVSGTGTAGDTIIVKVGERVLGTTTVAQDGTWSVQVENSNALATGPNAIVAEERDPAGNAINSAPYTVTVDSDAPVQPPAPEVFDDQGEVQGLLNNGDTTDDARPEFRGKGDSGDTITVLDGDVIIGTATVDPDGAWTITPTSDLSNGDHSFTTVVTDAAGNPSQPSQAVDITIATGPTSAPQITGLVDDIDPVTGSIAAGGATNDTQPQINGIGNAGEVITVREGSETLGSATVQPDGTWSVTPEFELSDGLHSITATARNAAGNTSESSAAVEFTVDTQPPPSGSAAITGALDDVDPITGALSSGDSTNDTTPTFQGTAEPGDTVRVYDGGNYLGETQASPDGAWTFTPPELAEGLHDITIIALDAAGNPGPESAPFEVIIDTQAPTFVSIDDVYDDAGLTHGTVAPGGYTDDNTPRISGSGEAGSVVVVQFSDAAGVHSLGSTTVSANGTWSLQVEQALSDGSVQFVAIATDSAGNPTQSAAYAINVDTAAISAQAAIDLDTASDNGVNATDNITSVTNPLINGTVSGLNAADMAEVNAGSVTATLFDDVNNNGMLDAGDTVFADNIAVSAAGSNGATFSHALPLMPDGTYNLKSVLVDSSGNQSDAALLDDNPAARLVIDRDQASSGVGTQADDGLGWDMTSAGDFNGDGFEDFLVSAPHMQRGSEGGGANSDLYLVYGGVEGLPSLSDMDNLTPDQGIRMNNAGVTSDIGKTGININQMGDINGDGYDDIIIGGHREDSAYVLFGRETGTSQINLGSIFASGANANGFRFGWGGAWTADGASGGDINGDGYADILVTESSGNTMYVLYGNAAAAGTGTWAHNYEVRGDGLYNHTTGQKVTSGASFISSPGGNSSFADHLNMVGDVNHDGYQDFIMTYPDQAADGNTYAGNAYLVWGSAQQLPASMQLTDYANIGIRIGGAEHGEQLGDIVHDQGGAAHGNGVYGATNTVAELGDINGDGIADFAIGSPGWGDNQNDDGMAPGRTYVVFGKSGSWSDFNLDSLNGTNGFTLSSSGLGTNPNLGNGVRGAGDVNGDGLDDFLMGAPNADTNGLTDNGATYLVYGRAGGYQADMDLEALVASGLARRWDGDAERDFSGTNAAMGDWNGDGLADIGISSWESDDGAPDGGRYDIYTGEVGNLTQAFTVADDQISATAGVDRLSGGVGNDTLSAIGAGDVAYGGAGDDVIGIVSDGFARVDGGLGIDTLVFSGSGMNVDLSALGLKVQGFEKFDLGTGANRLSLDVTDVIEHGEHNLALQDGKVQMQVDGDGGVLSLSTADGWTNAGTASVDGAQYSVYTSGNAELLVEDKVQVAIL